MITTCEVQNVLRVYGNQLRKRSSHLEESPVPSGASDLVDISMSARRKQMLSRVSHQLISALAPGAQGGPNKEEENVQAQELLLNHG